MTYSEAKAGRKSASQHFAYIYIHVCVIIFSYIFGYTLTMGNDDDDPPLDFGAPHFYIDKADRSDTFLILPTEIWPCTKNQWGLNK